MCNTIIDFLLLSGWSSPTDLRHLMRLKSMHFISHASAPVNLGSHYCFPICKITSTKDRDLVQVVLHITLSCHAPVPILRHGRPKGVQTWAQATCSTVDPLRTPLHCQSAPPAPRSTPHDRRGHRRSCSAYPHWPSTCIKCGMYHMRKDRHKNHILGLSSSVNPFWSNTMRQSMLS